MKFAIFLSSSVGFLASFAAAAETSDLGKVMCIGDSLTHGVNSGSWRWAMHKILVDNGIRYTEVGVKQGNDSGGVRPGTAYRGVVFRNVHSAHASAHAREISGRVAGPRFNGANIGNWLGLNAAMANAESYTGATYAADAFYLLAGTNDLLGMHNLGATEEEIRAGAKAKFAALLGDNGDVPRIVDAAFTACPHASFSLFSIPAWTKHNRHNINSPAAHECIADYNKELQGWVGRYNAAHGTSVRYVDINRGLIDVTSTVPMTGVASMYNCLGKDGLHPNAQGDLLIAGNVAKAHGFGGRSLGLDRRDAACFSLRADREALVLAPGECRTFAWGCPAEHEGGFTVELVLPGGLGDGEANGWDTAHCLSVQVGDGAVSGTLRIDEAAIRWDNCVLYSMDMSGDVASAAYTVYDKKAAIRIVYTPGKPQGGIAPGFYVWLGGMLIGEACPSSPGGTAGITLSNRTEGRVPVHLEAEQQPYAPPHCMIGE